MHYISLFDDRGGSVAAPDAAWISSYVDALLRDVRFHEIVGLVGMNTDDAHEAFEIMQPLLTRVLKVAWGELVPSGASWRDVVRTIRQLMGVLADRPEWTVEAIEDSVSIAASGLLTKSLCASRILYQCVLSSEFRLPLAEAVWQLGRTECIARLNYVGNSLEQMNLVS